MDLRSIYVANGVGVVLMLILLFVSRTRISGRRVEGGLLIFMVLGIMLGCCLEMLAYTVDGRLFPGARLINYIANTCLFTINLLLPFSLMVYVDLGLYDDPGRIRTHYKVQIIVGCVVLAANLLNLFVPVVYFISPENVYARRPLSYVYFFVILFYCATAFFLTRRYERENGAKTFFNISLFLVPVLLGAALQFLFYGLSLAWIAAAVGLVGLFMMQQNEQAYLDSLTGTYNRQYLNHILSAWISRGRGFAGAMLDLDDFKRINDVFGHTEGDSALTTVADLLKRSRITNEWVFRFAGDEFIILRLTDDPDGLTAYMAEVERRLAAYNVGRPYQIALSYGVSYFRSGSIDAFMREMDDKMYAMKERHHALTRDGKEGSGYAH